MVKTRSEQPGGCEQPGCWSDHESPTQKVSRSPIHRNRLGK